jgi:hypothetical protein
MRKYAIYLMLLIVMLLLSGAGCARQTLVLCDTPPNVTPDPSQCGYQTEPVTLPIGVLGGMWDGLEDLTGNFNTTEYKWAN